MNNKANRKPVRVRFRNRMAVNVGDKICTTYDNSKDIKGTWNLIERVTQHSKEHGVAGDYKSIQVSAIAITPRPRKLRSR